MVQAWFYCRRMCRRRFSGLYRLLRPHAAGYGNRRFAHTAPLHHDYCRKRQWNHHLRQQFCRSCLPKRFAVLCAGGGGWCRRPSFLFAFRLWRHCFHPRHDHKFNQTALCPGRQHHHPASGQKHLPYARKKHQTQSSGAVNRLLAGIQVQQRTDFNSVHQPCLFRFGRLRHWSRRQQIFRQKLAWFKLKRGRPHCRHAQSAVALQSVCQPRKSVGTRQSCLTVDVWTRHHQQAGNGTSRSRTIGKHHKIQSWRRSSFCRHGL